MADGQIPVTERELADIILAWADKPLFMDQASKGAARAIIRLLRKRRENHVPATPAGGRCRSLARLGVL